jgi:PAS domain S-box-containing protein
MSHEFFRKIERGFPLAGLLETLPDIYFFAKDLRGQFVAANSAMLQALGLSHESEMLGRTDYDVVPAEIADEYREQDRRIHLHREPLRNDVQLVPDRTGSLTWYLVTKVPLLSEKGTVIGVAGLMRDVHSAGAVLGPYKEITPVLHYIMQNYRGHIAVEDLAEITGMSVRQLERRFKSLFRVTPVVYVNRHRVQKACLALRNSEASVTDVALQVGFYDSSHFVRQFRRFMGMTPTEYREHFFD